MTLGLLQRLTPNVIGMLGALIVLLHNLLDPIHASGLGRFANLWMILHQRGFLLYHGRPVVNLSFPVLSWFGVMCLGYAFGPVLILSYSKRRRIVLGLSGVFLLSFALLRILHGYGDSNRFAHMPTASRTMMSFLQVQKFPPSLQYIVATVGVLLLIYAAFDHGVQRDWEKGFADLGEKLKSPEIKSFFVKESAQRGAYAKELEAELALAAGDTKDIGGTAAGAVHRVWGDLKASLGGSDHTLLETAEQGEDVAKKAYKEALEVQDLPSTKIRELLFTQQAHIQISHDIVKAFRDSTAA